LSLAIAKIAPYSPKCVEGAFSEVCIQYRA
jgi:hypothetical protein